VREIDGESHYPAEGVERAGILADTVALQPRYPQRKLLVIHEFRTVLRAETGRAGGPLEVPVKMLDEAELNDESIGLMSSPEHVFLPGEFGRPCGT
jgi:hypothetical protein